MPAPTSYHALITALKATADAVAGLGQFDDVPGGPSPWVRTGRPAGHWWAEVLKASQVITSSPGVARTMLARKTYLVLVEGWYPVISASDSDSVWGAKLDALINAVERNPFLSLDTGIMLDKLTVAEDSQGLKTSLHQGDQAMLCHYGKLLLTYVHEFQFTTVD